MSHYPPRIVCYVCGLEGPADYPLYISPHGYTGLKSQPFFPFLSELEPPLGCRAPDQQSAVFSCRQCYSALMRQWDDNEQGGVPTEMRVYWTKRITGLAILDPEQQLAVNKREAARYPGLRSSLVVTAPARSSAPTESRVMVSSAGLIEMGPPSSALPPADPAGETDTDSALDLSSGARSRDTMKSCSSAMSHISAVSHHSSYMSEGAGSSTDILDLTLPDKNATTEVCYVCGDEFKKGCLNYIHTRPVSRSSHFPSLVHHPRPPRSRPMDSAGRVQACEECGVHLIKQWEKFESEKLLSHSDRNYILRKRQTPVVDTTTFVCYICALDYHSSSLRLLYCRSNSENEPYYPQVEQQRPPPGASPISSGGMVQVCSHCYKCTRDKYTGYVTSVGPEPPPKKRKSSRAASVPEIVADLDQSEEDGKQSPADVECPLCRRKFTVHSFKFLHSQGPPLGGQPYFPFLRTLSRLTETETGLLSDDDSQGRVRVCQACHNSLINQWTSYQREATPMEERSYSFQSLVGQMSSCGERPQISRATPTPTSGRSLHSPGALGSSISGGAATPSKCQSENVRPRSNSNTVHENQSVTVKIITEPPSRPRSNSNPHSPRVAGQPPTCHSPISVHSATSADPAHCRPNTSSFYCFLCGLHSELSFARMLYSEPQGKKAPHFPFMKSHSPKLKAEILREDGTALVCTFCYHSVMEQWTRYQNEKNPVSPSLRKYNVNDYVCFVCHIKTYRKRIRALRVMDFPFIRQHKPTKGTITLENGDMAAVCLDCFQSLKNQFVEGAKYGVPVTKRQYNWMQIPPPPEDSVTLVTPKERLDKHISDSGATESERQPAKKSQLQNQQHKDRDSSSHARQPSHRRTQAAPPSKVHVEAAMSTGTLQQFKPQVTRSTFSLAQPGPSFQHSLGLPTLGLSPSTVQPWPSFSPSPGLPYQALHNPPHPPGIVTTFGLESDPLYRAQLERYAASTSLCGLNPGLLEHFMPTNTGQRNISSTVTSGQAGRNRTEQQQQQKKLQSGNGEAPPALTFLGWEGLYITNHRTVNLVCVLLDSGGISCDISTPSPDTRASSDKLSRVLIFFIFLLSYL